MTPTQVTTQGSLSVEMKTYYDRVLLQRAIAEFVFDQFAQRRPLGRGQGKTIEFRKFNSLTPATTPLTEGVTPTGDSLTASAITATIAQYGNYVEGSDILDLTAFDPLLTETAQLLGENAADTLNRIVRAVLFAGTNVQYANNRASRVTVAAGDVLTVLEIRKARRTLRRNKVKPLVGNDYVAFVNEGAVFDLQSDSDWKTPSQYSAVQQIFDGEIGRLYGVRFIESTENLVFTGAGASGIDVNATVVLGQDAYGIIPLEGASLEFIFKQIGSAGAADPLNQRWTSGWKNSFATKILNDLNMVRIEHAISG